MITIRLVEKYRRSPVRKFKTLLAVGLASVGIGAAIVPAAQAYRYTPEQSQKAWQQATYYCLHYQGCTSLAFDGIRYESYYTYGGYTHWTTHYQFDFWTSYCGHGIIDTAVTDYLTGYVLPLSGLGNCGYYERTF